MTDRPSGAPVKRSVTIAGHRTSLSLEQEFWAEIIKLIADQRQISLSQLIKQIDAERGNRNLSSACRICSSSKL